MRKGYQRQILIRVRKEKYPTDWKPSWTSSSSENLSQIRRIWIPAQKTKGEKKITRKGDKNAFVATYSANLSALYNTKMATYRLELDINSKRESETGGWRAEVG